MRADFRGVSTITRPRFAVAAFAAALFVCAGAGSAHAFCRSTTCSEARGDDCPPDTTGCVLNGLPLAWRSNCMTFSVQRDGSPKNGIDSRTFEVVIETAFQTWLNVDCGGGTHPSIDVTASGEVECKEGQYNWYQGNANVYLFIDENWDEDHSPIAFALTTVSHNWKTGEILDVDVEVNGSDGDLTNSEPEDGPDLPSIITHETGHFLGLADMHTSFGDKPTMYGQYVPGVDNLRDLSQDDIDGICAVYPPARQAASTECTPRRGFRSTCGTGETKPDSDGCSCSVVPGSASARGGWLALGVGILGVLTRRRRRTRR